METSVSPIENRKVTFTVSQDEAKQICGFLHDALSANLNTPWSSGPIRAVMYAFNDVVAGK